uniref:CLAVATA3/ESR (CLE)-related protein TDIF-like n=1 Tax=Cicer arietinum TaxID=3827 RepID=A0A1S2XP14_CICAR|nr:CLAVATA3/ESR (CLE)-related protein TDIF-like [Cicer arietinum]
MDIDPLWALGGWIFLSNCMAQPKTSSHLFSKSPTLFHFLTLFFILLLIINLSHQPTSTMVSTKSTMSTTNLHPPHKTKNSQKDQKAARDQFGSDAHEVPSGPNPISNR